MHVPTSPLSSFSLTCKLCPYPVLSQELAKLTGSMLGSQFVPVFHVRQPKPMLVGMSALMAAFLAAFALTRHFTGGPAAMLALIFSCYAFGG